MVTPGVLRCLPVFGGQSTMGLFCFSICIFLTIVVIPSLNIFCFYIELITFLLEAFTQLVSMSSI